jgi:integrase
LPRVVRGEPVFLGHDQVVELAAAAEPYGLLVRFLAYAGRRWGEMSALRVTNLDLLRRRMRITSAFVEVRGQLVEGTPKTPQVRTVPLPRFLVDELAAHVEGLAPDALVFTTANGAPLWYSNFRRRHLGPGVRPRRGDASRPSAHSGEPRDRGGSEREGGAADARARLGGDDARRVRRAVR